MRRQDHVVTSVSYGFPMGVSMHQVEIELEAVEL
jgi:hypothetical protein